MKMDQSAAVFEKLISSGARLSRSAIFALAKGKGWPRRKF
jgi:hypothetical protein